MSNNLDVIRMNAAKAFALDMLMAGAWTLPKTLPMNTNDEQAPYGPTAQQAADRLAHALKDMDKPIERKKLRQFDVVRTSDGNLAMIEEVSKGMNDASLLYFDPIPLYVKWAWWRPDELDVLYNIGDMITGGELRVNKKATRVPGAKVHTYGCSECGTEWGYYNFCPGCGSQIVKG